MEQHRKPSLTPVIVGAIISVALIAIFLVLEKRASGIMKLPQGWIILAVIPVLIGLLVGNYITSLKTPFGEVARELPTAGDVTVASPEKSYQPTPDAIVTDQATVAEMVAEHYRFEAECHDLALVHTFAPATERGQKYDAFVFLSRHVYGANKKNEAGNLDYLVQQADFTFGESWGNRVFRAKIDGGPIGVKVLAWGSFWVTCKVTFREQPGQDEPRSVYIHRYVDFESGKLLH